MKRLSHNNSPSSPPPFDSETACYICNNIIINDSKCLKCINCAEWVHIKYSKVNNKQYEYFRQNPDEFDCRICCICTLCNKLVAKNHHGIVCHCCKKFIHKKCNKLNDRDYRSYQTDKTLSFQCMNCLKETLPGMGLNNKEFSLTMDGIDIPDQINVDEIFLSEVQIEIISKINSVIDNGFGNENNNDVNYEIPTINCKYYTTENFNDEKFDSSSSSNTSQSSI